MQFFNCTHCGNVIHFLNTPKVPVQCCGEKMKELVPNTVDASTEKHIPIVVKNDNKVEVVVGETIHPMTEEHHIVSIILETNKGYKTVNLAYTDEPKAEFCLCCGEEVVAIYEYCNLHGLWKA